MSSYVGSVAFGGILGIVISFFLRKLTCTHSTLKAHPSGHSGIVAEFQLFDILANGVHEVSHSGMKIYCYCLVFIDGVESKVHEFEQSIFSVWSFVLL